MLYTNKYYNHICIMKETYSLLSQMYAPIQMPNITNIFIDITKFEICMNSLRNIIYLWYNHHKTKKCAYHMGHVEHKPWNVSLCFLVQILGRISITVRKFSIPLLQMDSFPWQFTSRVLTIPARPMDISSSKVWCCSIIYHCLKS